VQELLVAERSPLPGEHSHIKPGGIGQDELCADRERSREGPAGFQDR